MNDIRAGRAYVEFLLKDQKLKAGLAKVGAKLQSIGKIGAAATAPLIAGFAAASVAFAETGAHLDDLSKRTGISGGALSELSYAAQQSGTDINVLANGVSKLQKNITAAAAGGGKFAETLAAMNVDVAALAALSPEQQFLTIADAISKVADPTNRAALAQQAFGGAAKQLLPLLAEGRDGIDALRKAGVDLGISMSTEQTQAAAEFDDALSELKQQTMGVAMQIGAALAPALVDLLNYIKPIIADVIEWIKQNPQLVVTVAAVTAGIAALSVAAYTLGTALTVLLAHPVVLVMVGIAAAVWAVIEAYQKWAEICEWVASSLDGVEEAQYAVNETVKDNPAVSQAAIAEASRIQSQAAASVAAGQTSMIAPGASAASSAKEMASAFGEEVAKNTAEAAKSLAAIYNLMTRGNGGFRVGAG